MSYLNGLVVFPTFFNLSLNLAKRSSWSGPQSTPGLVFADCIELLHLWLSVYYLFAFSYCSLGFQGKNTEVVCQSLLQWTTFCQTSPQWPSHLGWPHTVWLSFIDLDKLWSMWSDWLVVCDCCFRLFALWCPLSAPTVLLGFLLPWTWESLQGCSSKAAIHQ